MKRCKRLLGLLAALVLAAVLYVPAQAAAEPDWDGAAQKLIEGLVNRKAVITLYDYKIPNDEFAAWYAQTVDTSTELFHVKASSCKWTKTSYAGTSVIYQVYPEYGMTEDEAAAYDTALQRALHVVNDQMPDLEKALALHDYLVLHCAYDKTYSRHSPYQALVEGSAVCDGYADAYSDLLLLCGIENAFASNSNHRWNLVKLNGQWYHVDVTWDDPLCSASERYSSTDLPGRVGHGNFLLSDAGAAAQGHSSWQADYTCTDATYDDGAFWSSLTGAVWFDADGTCYYLKGESYGSTVSLYARSGAAGTATLLAEVKTGAWTWTTYGTESVQGWYLWKYGDSLVFNGPDAVYCYSLADGSLTTLKTWAADNVFTHVYGLWMEDNAVYARRIPLNGTAADELVYTFAHLHAYGEGTVTAPTCTAGGYTTYTCTECGDSYTADEVPALGHSDRLGVCTVCGRVDPEFVLAPGDLNGDGSVTVEDALILANALAEKYALNAPQQQAAALDALEGITVTDLTRLMRMVVGAAA